MASTDVDVDEPASAPALAPAAGDDTSAAGRAAARAAARAELAASRGGEAGSPEAAAAAYRKLSAMRTSQLQQRLQALSARDPRLGVEMVLQRSPQTSKAQAMKALSHSQGDVERAILRLSEPELLSPKPAPETPASGDSDEIEMMSPGVIDLDVSQPSTPQPPRATTPLEEEEEEEPRRPSPEEERRSRRSESGSLAVARQQIRRLEAQARRLGAIAELEKQEKMILIEDMNTMHAAQKEQILQDRRHLQQMDETNEQLCEDLIQAEAGLTLLRKLGSGSSGGLALASKSGSSDEDEFDVDGGPSLKTATAVRTPARQSSAEVE